MSTSPHTAKRQHGVCMGSLWKQHIGGPSSSSQQADDRKTFEYCVLVGVTMTSFADVHCYKRGDHPTGVLRIVGASAWNSAAGPLASETISSSEAAFRLMTLQGTHIYCTAMTSSDRDVWLASLHAGLEASLESRLGEEPTLLPPSPAAKHRRPKLFRDSKQVSCCQSCGKLHQELQACPLPQYGRETRCQICPECLVSQGVLLDVQRLSNLYHMQAYEKKAMQTARELCWKALQTEWTEVPVDDWVQVPAVSTKDLVEVIQSINFASYRRICPVLDTSCRMLEHGISSPAEFLEGLQDSRPEEEQAAELKKQAFRVAGDMGSAMKLLQDHALGHYNNTAMLSYVLEFLLDLCEEGEISPVAFFWPQLQCLHLRMLPPEDAQALVRVDLLEDFLLTVSTKYSVQLALDLVWGHVADLEDSLYNTHCAPVCRRRRFSVLRFVCELESLLFDFEYGWGGGSVSLRNMLSPSPHQVSILRQSMINLQSHRQSQPSLTRSARLEKLNHTKRSLPPDEAAQEALRIARNADYFSSHLSFTRRLCDIAERLRFMDVEKRAPTLERELSSLNMSGGMGGDPLNRAQDNLIRVIRVPSREGHVFRSKERTPVLLLMEIIEEGVEEMKEEEECHAAFKGSVKTLESIGNHGDRRTSKPDSPVRRSSSTSEVTKSPTSLYIMDGELPGNESDSHLESSDEVDEMRGDAVRDGELPGTDVANHHDSCDKVDKVQGDDTLVDAGRPGNDSDSHFDSSDEVDDSEGDVAKAKEVTDGFAEFATFEQSSTELEHPSSGPHHPSPRALGRFNRFESPTSVHGRQHTPSLEDVEAMVNIALVHQLNLPELGTNGDDRAERDGHGRRVTNHDSFTENGSGQRQSSSTSRLSRNFSWMGSNRNSTATGETSETPNVLPSDEIRRKVLTTIMMKGMRGSNAIAAGAAASAQRSLQELDRKRAVELILHGDDPEVKRYVPPGQEAQHEEVVSARQKLLEMGLGLVDSQEDDVASAPNEDDEAMEALRLLLLQNRVGQGTLSPASAAEALAPIRTSSVLNVAAHRVSGDPNQRNHPVDESEMIEIEAGDVDPRLAGCGALPPAVLSALTLWKGGVVSNGELLELVKKDLNYIRQSALPGAENADKLIEDSKFWGRFAFGERWAEKKARIAASSPQGCLPGWDLMGIIVKSNDDLRQEAFVMQLIELCQEAFEMAGLELWLHPYRILATGRTTGIIEMVRNAMSFDALKKRPGYGKGGLREHLKRMTEFTADPEEAFRSAQRNFVSSLAAYSLLSYFFLFKDRHNGNILLDTAGHVIHIDFGFVFGVAPGGSFSLEMSAPFKLTEEMLEVMGGLGSPLFSEFVTLFCCGFLALQVHVDTFATIVEMTCEGSSFKCFDGRDSDEAVSKMRERFVPQLSKESTVAFALDLIKQATTSYGTKQYDYFQYLSQGIAA